MFTRKSAKSFFGNFLFLTVLLGGVAATDAQPVTPQGRPSPTKTIKVKSGSIKLEGGILVSKGTKTELLVQVTNRTSKTVWAEVEFQLPENRETLKKKIKKGKTKKFKWEMKKEKIRWDEEYPFTVSLFSDKKQKNLLSSNSYSFLFDGQTQQALEEVRDGDRVIVSGWPTFTWDATYSDPAASLVITEKQRMSFRGSTMVGYGIRATGFSAEENWTLWQKMGGDFKRLPATLTQEGTVQIIAGVDTIMLGGYMRGEPFDLAMFAGDSGKRAHAKVYPFPIQAQGEGGCSATLELLSESGYLFLVLFQGFQPGEEVTYTSRYKQEKHTAVLEASGDGAFGIPILFGPPDRGTATVSAAGENCTASLEYKVGKDATKLP